MTELRILTIIESLGRGGAEQALVNLLPALRSRGHHVAVAALQPPYSLQSDLESAGVPVYRVDLNHHWNLPQGVSRLVRVARGGDFDILHSHLFYAGVYSALTYPFLGPVTRVATFHNLGYDSYPATTLRLKLRKRLDAVLMRWWVDGRIGVSGAVARHYATHLGLPSITTIPNAIPVELVRPRPELDRGEILSRYRVSPGNFVMIYGGRLVREKGHRFFLNALQLLKARGFDFQALVVGDGPLRSEVALQIDRCGLQDCVQMHPAIPHEEMLLLLQAGDLLVQSPTHEGLGVLIAEAMALERPVVATCVGGIIDLIEDGVSGVMAPPSNPEALASQITRLMQDASLRHRLGAAARERIVRQFSDTAVASRLEQYYQSILRRRTGHRQSGVHPH